MKMLAFARRCAREILRDPINLIFGLGFPLVLLFLLSAMQANIPVNLFEIDTLTPGITIFGLSFMTLFSATLVAKDRESAFLQRLYTTPLKEYQILYASVTYFHLREGSQVSVTIPAANDDATWAAVEAAL